MAHLKLVKNDDLDDLMEGIKFLLGDAKSDSYALGTENWENSLDGGKRFFSKKGKLGYSDQFWGFNPFWGFEAIVELKSGKPKWFMGYYGIFFKPVFGGIQLITNKPRIRGITNFLQSALLQPDPLIPLRGHAGKRLGLLEYRNDLQQGSTLKKFAGREIITHGGEPRYNLDYHGGIII
jgi:hypothetical protein